MWYLTKYSWTAYNQPPKMPSLSGHLQGVIAYERADHKGVNFESIAQSIGDVIPYKSSANHRISMMAAI